jgi:sucrose phosphorylase
MSGRGIDRPTDNLDIARRMSAKLVEIYGPETGASTLQRLVDLINAQPIPPRAAPLTEKDVVVIAYGDHIQSPSYPPLQSLQQFLKKRLSRIVNTIHILPFYPYSSDDGFSVIDYRAVDPNLGSWDDIAALRQDFGLMFDLVLNHVSVSSAWFRAFLRDEPPYRDYFVTADPSVDLSMVTRPRTHPLLTPFETTAGTRHVWTTFSADQVDLNFANPAVLLEMIDILLFYVRQGADLIRLDAVAYLWKTLNTTCIHLPQTHLVVQLFRDVLDMAAPWVRLITETNVPHQENISYFGDGTNEAQMVYQFALPPLVVHSFQTGNAEALSAWASTLEDLSPTTTFFNFTASHDGIGVRPATGLLTAAQIQAMLDRVVRYGGQISYKINSDGTQSAYEMNISYFNALSAPSDPLQVAIDRFIGSQAIMLALAGVPGIYLHSLLGSTNWQEGVKLTGRARTINREKLDAATVERELADINSRRAQIFRRYSALLAIRRADPAFHPKGAQQVFSLHPSVFALHRIAPDSSSHVLALHNVAGQPAPVTLPPGYWRNLHDEQIYSGRLTLTPYQVAWMKEV